MALTPQVRLRCRNPSDPAGAKPRGSNHCTRKAVFGERHAELARRSRKPGNMAAAITTEPKAKKKAESPEPVTPVSSQFGLEGIQGAPAGMPLFLAMGPQRKLAVGAGDDPLEREADRVAEQVLASKSRTRPGMLAPTALNPGHSLGCSPPAIQRKCACGASAAGQCEECNQKDEQQKPTATAPQKAPTGPVPSPSQKASGDRGAVPKQPAPPGAATNPEPSRLRDSIQSVHVAPKTGPPAHQPAPLSNTAATGTPPASQGKHPTGESPAAGTPPAQKAPPGSKGLSAQTAPAAHTPSRAAATTATRSPASPPAPPATPAGGKTAPPAPTAVSGAKCMGVPGERCSSATPQPAAQEAAITPVGPPANIPVVPMCTCPASAPSGHPAEGSSAVVPAGAGAAHKCSCPAKSQQHATPGKEPDELAMRGVVQRQPSGEPQGAASVPSEAIGGEGDGEPLDRDTREFMEPRFGADFSQVRVHTGPGAARSAQLLAANAYTVGSDIYFAPGQYRPGGEQGRRLIAHELTHTIQQGASLHRSPSQPEESRLSSPEDAHELEAREVSDVVMSSAGDNTESRGQAVRDRQSDVRNLITPARFGVISRDPQRQRPDEVWSPETVFATNPDIQLFGMHTPISKHWRSEPAFVPLAGGTFIVEGIPISYNLQGSYSAASRAFLSFGPGTLEQIRIIVTGAEAERMRRPRVVLLPLIPPVPIPVNLPPDPTPHGKFSADAYLRFGALAMADASASAKLEGQVGVFGNALNAGAFAGLEGSAHGEAWSNIDTWVQFTWNDGAISLSTTVDLTAGASLAFHLGAFAGVRVELRVPEIPVVTNLTHKVQDWPIVGWFVPDLSRWKWQKEYRKDWPILDKSYNWDLQERFVIGDASSSGDFANLQGFQMDNVLSDLQAQQKAGDLKDDPKGPGKELRDSDTGAVSLVRASALAQIASARRAADREKQANGRLMISARKAAAAKTAGGSSGTPALAAVTPTSDPVTELQKRDETLNDAVASTQHLRDRVNELETPANAPDGVTRNEARAGLETIEKNAGALSDAINNNQEGFAVPKDAEPSDADYEAMRAARIKANDAFDKCFDIIRTEKLFADDQVRAAGSDADLHTYRDAAVVYQGEALKLWNRVQKLDSDLERAREWYEKGDYGMGAKVFDELESKAILLEDEGRMLKKDRPVGDWDIDYAELSGGHIQLKPEFRGKRTRSEFYPHDYSAATINRMWLQIGSVHTGDDGNQYWEYRHKKSPRGDFMWLVNDDREQPTLDHTAPTVLAHWNYQGGRTTDYPPRRSFYDFQGAALVVVPKTLNSSAGGRDPDSYTPIVTRRFRGAKT